MKEITITDKTCKDSRYCRKYIEAYGPDNIHLTDECMSDTECVSYCRTEAARAGKILTHFALTGELPDETDPEEPTA